MKKEYHGHGYIYDDGDIPTCSFCGNTAEDGIIHSGDYSGEHICEDSSCAVEYMNQNILINPFEVKEVEVVVCDWCEEQKEDCEAFHDVEGEEVCDYCYEENEDGE